VTVSTHVLDAASGQPAADVPVTLSRWSSPAPSGPAGPDAGADAADGGGWRTVESAATDADGRHRFDAVTEPGTYRLTFATGGYFAARKVATFYPEVTVTFTVAEGGTGHWHVPLLLSPFAYSTYRGS
jgi:5-hydroxyisourate hydrolase